ncbi:MAG: diadenylate cyclase CdaA [Eubacteriales bacterium]
MIKNSLALVSIRDIIDIIIVAAVIYGILKITSKTRAMQVLKGLGILFIVSRISEWLSLQTLTWLLNNVINAGALVVVILFQPELRRALERIGRGKLFYVNGEVLESAEHCVEAVSKALLNLSKVKIGAIIVFEQKVGLKDVIETGTILNAQISGELIENIFQPNTPLHDGAVIIRGTTLVAAGCFLPLSDNKKLEKDLGTRHRAALGISEVSDSTTIIVSEETGILSMAYDGKLTRYMDSKQLKEVLEDIFFRKNMAKSVPINIKKKVKKA